MSTLKWSPSYPGGFVFPIFPNLHQRFWSRIESFFDFLYVLQLSLQKELFLAIDNFPCSIWLDDWDKLFQMIPAKIVFNVRRLDCPTGVHKAQGYLKAYKVNQFMWNLKLISNKNWINNWMTYTKLQFGHSLNPRVCDKRNFIEYEKLCNRTVLTDQSQSSCGHVCPPWPYGLPWYRNGSKIDLRYELDFGVNALKMAVFDWLMTVDHGTTLMLVFKMCLLIWAAFLRLSHL